MNNNNVILGYITESNEKENKKVNNVFKRYTLFVNGVKVRCRKIDRHSFRLGDDLSVSQIVERTNEVLKTKIKSITGNIKIIYNTIETEDQGAFKVERCCPFDFKTVFNGTLDQLNSNAKGGE